MLARMIRFSSKIRRKLSFFMANEHKTGMFSGKEHKSYIV